jgi:hypothetical protein
MRFEESHLNGFIRAPAGLIKAMGFIRAEFEELP